MLVSSVTKSEISSENLRPKVSLGQRLDTSRSRPDTETAATSGDKQSISEVSRPDRRRWEEDDDADDDAYEEGGDSITFRAGGKTTENASFRVTPRLDYLALLSYIIILMHNIRRIFSSFDVPLSLFIKFCVQYHLHFFNATAL
ncbi:unnamed protein product [Protopolystoma xenopodis]|uniref:Uncharacterized protein n=1 Tax=Protopolystoma xenopodis TaxID=117903 RepID=A0A448WY35_9PLAT|nr:unnamed protein product [Protopolystoma xenopodis]